MAGKLLTVDRTQTEMLAVRGVRQVEAFDFNGRQSVLHAFSISEPRDQRATQAEAFGTKPRLHSQRSPNVSRCALSGMVNATQPFSSRLKPRSHAHSVPDALRYPLAETA